MPATADNTLQKLFWICAMWFAVIAVGLSLNACALSGKTYPFGKGNKSMARGVAKNPPPLYLSALNGLPPGKTRQLFAHLVAEARKRNMNFIAGPTEKSFELTGHFSAARTPRGIAIAYVWDLRGKKHEQWHRLTGEKTLPGHSAADMWIGIDQRMMVTIARESAERLAGWMSKLGFRIKQAPVPPPNMKYVRRPPQPVVQPAHARGAPRRITPPANTHHGRANAPQLALPAQLAPRVATPNRAAFVPRNVAARAASGIHVAPVRGASPPAAAILTQTLRRRLKLLGLQIAPVAQHAAWVVTGRVVLGATAGQRQNVSVRWQVQAASGAELGSISQNNHIDSRTASGDWGGSARHAATAAADGIANLLRRNNRI